MKLKRWRVINEWGFYRKYAKRFGGLHKNV